MKARSETEKTSPSRLLLTSSGQNSRKESGLVELTFRSSRPSRRAGQPAGGVEELLGTVEPQPGLEHRKVLGVLPYAGERDLMGPRVQPPGRKHRVSFG